MYDGRRRATEAYLSCKLTKWAEGSDELRTRDNNVLWKQFYFCAMNFMTKFCCPFCWRHSLLFCLVLKVNFLRWLFGEPSIDGVERNISCVWCASSICTQECLFTDLTQKLPFVPLRILTISSTLRASYGGFCINILLSEVQATPRVSLSICIFPKLQKHPMLTASSTQSYVLVNWEYFVVLSM